MKPLRSFWLKEALGLTLALESGKGLEARVRSILDTSRSRELLTRRALFGIGLGTAASVSLVALMAPKRSLPGKGKPIPANTGEQAWPEEIHGRVFLPDGSPAVGAMVQFQSSTRGNRRLIMVGFTDAEGHYQMPINSKGERFVIVVFKEGFGPEGTYQPEADLTLTPATDFQVRAVDETGKPLPNLPLSVEFLSTNSYTTIAGIGGGTTDAEGIATLTDLPPQAMVLLNARSADYCQAKFTGYDQRQGSVQTAPKNVVFPRAALVSGHIVFPEGMLLTRVRVAAQEVNGENAGETVCDRNGNYTLKLPTGTYNIALDLGDMPDWTTRAQAGIHVRAGQNLMGFDFTLERGSLISGRVLGGDDRPIVGYSVGVYGPAHPKTSAWVQATKTDSAGRYQLRVPAGEQYLYLQGGVPPLGYILPKDKDRTFTLAKNATRTEDFILPTTEILPPVTGTVRDASGAPVAGATLRVEGKEFEDSYDYQALGTDAAGRFTFHLRTRKPFTLTAERHGLYSEPTPIAPGQEHTLTLKEPGALSGAILGADGTPVSDIAIFLSRSIGSQGFFQVAGNTATDATGHYHFAGLQPGEHYRVSVDPDHKNDSFSDHQSETVKIPPGGTVTLKPITLRHGP